MSSTLRSAAYLLQLCLLCVAFRPAHSRKVANRPGCHPDSLLQYNITFVGKWSEKKFPKMYPHFRPHAQWSKLVGRTHSDGYTMWSLDTFASPAVKMFAENANTAEFDKDSQGSNGVFDLFTAPPVSSGIGKTSGAIFVDGTHTKISLMMKIIPSPDWFVGVDSLDLCHKRKWRRKAIVKLFPVDAGTDEGYTFTSPNWPKYPHEKIYQITSKYPNHGASSFHYPSRNSLPKIGYVIFRKVGEYKNRKRKKINNNIDVTISNKSKQALGKSGRKKLQPKNGLKDKPSHVQADQSPTPSKQGMVELVLDHTENSRLSQEVHINTEGPATPLDCVVGSWEPWSPCTKTCGFGQKMRRRLVTRRPQNSGQGCPLLAETVLCGSMKNCKWDHFRRPFSKWQD